MLRSTLFFAIILISTHLSAMEKIPLDASNWTSLKFNKIPDNQVDFVQDQISIKVNSSASPLIYKLPQPKSISTFKIVAKLEGEKKIETGEFDEDSVLRVGFVALGDKKLNAFHRLISPAWVKKLFDLAPKDSGLDKIYFFNVTNRNELANRERMHPDSDLIYEKVVYVSKSANKDIEFTHKLDRSLEVQAFWLSVDGDQTKSNFQLDIKSIEIQ